MLLTVGSGCCPDTYLSHINFNEHGLPWAALRFARLCQHLLYPPTFHLTCPSAHGAQAALSCTAGTPLVLTALLSHSPPFTPPFSSRSTGCTLLSTWPAAARSRRGR